MNEYQSELFAPPKGDPHRYEHFGERSSHTDLFPIFMGLVLTAVGIGIGGLYAHMLLSEVQ